MVTLRLFHQTDPAHELDARVLDDGELAIGRGTEADWTIPDPSKALSRLHCILKARDGLLTLKDASSNGVWLATSGERTMQGVERPIAAGETLGLGDFLILVEAARAEQPAAEAPQAPGHEADATPAAAMLDAFCDGAGMDSSAFSADDPAELMHRAGALYRQMVLGLAALTGERVRSKAEHQLERTTVQALDNNPFRWAPPQRVAVDLLKVGPDAFLAGDAAVRASFEELRSHQLGLEAGWRAALQGLLQALSPETAAERLNGQSLLMKNKAAALWAEYLQLYAEAAKAGEARAFREAYQRAVDEQAATLRPGDPERT